MTIRNAMAGVADSDVTLSEASCAPIADPGSSLDPVVARNLAAALARDFEDASARVLARARAMGLDYRLIRGLDLVRALDSALTAEFDIGLARSIARALACELDDETVLGWGAALDLDDEVTRARHGLTSLVGHLEDATAANVRAAIAVPDHTHLRPSRAILRLTVMATRCLPTRHRSRYLGEFTAELHALAASRSSQWRYALSVLALAWMLRQELRHAHPHPAPGTRIE